MPCLWIGHSDLGKESGMHLLLAQRSEDFQRCTDCSDVKQKKGIALCTSLPWEIVFSHALWMQTEIGNGRRKHVCGPAKKMKKVDEGRDQFTTTEGFDKITSKLLCF